MCFCDWGNRIWPNSTSAIFPPSCFYHKQPHLPTPMHLQEMEQKLKSAEKKDGQQRNSSVIASSHKNKMSPGGLLMTPSTLSTTWPEAILEIVYVVCSIASKESALSEHCCSLISLFALLTLTACWFVSKSKLNNSLQMLHNNLLMFLLLFSFYHAPSLLKFL